MPSIKISEIEHDAVEIFLRAAWEAVAQTGIADHPFGDVLRDLEETGSVDVPERKFRAFHNFAEELVGSAKALTFEE